MPTIAPRAFLGMSHSPLLGLNPVSESVQASLAAAIDAARAQVQAFGPTSWCCWAQTTTTASSTS